MKKTDQIGLPGGNGAALAAFLAAAIGAFALGFIVLLGAAGIYSAPSLYGPAGGVSGRTTLAIVAWIIAWAILHNRWKNRQVDVGPVRTAIVLLLIISLVATFPPVWELL
jgi:multisubunit Na+/H+ antiporter MnhG subunit